MTNPTLSDRVRTLRKDRLWSQEQLALVSGVDVRTIQRIESGRPASMDSLKAIAAAFELDPSALVEAQPESGSRPPDLHLLERVRNGAELVRLIRDGDAWRFQHANLEDRAAAAQVGEFMDLVHDWGELASDVSPSDWLRLAGEFSDRLADLEKRGIWIFGLQTPHILTFGGKSVQIRVTDLIVAMQSDPSIVRLTPDRVVLPVRITPLTGFTA